MQNIMLDRRMQRRKELARFGRFLLVGLSGTLLDLAVLSVLKTGFGMPTLPANLISYSCGIISNFLLNRFWVYPEVRQSQALTQLIQFGLVSLVGLVLNNFIVLALENPAGSLLFHNPAYGYVPAKLTATAIGLIWSFLANRFWTFGGVRQSFGSEFDQRL